MPTLHWEDFAPGAVFEHGPRPVTREEIIAFAAEFDPQPMHLDEAAGLASMLGGLSASGWHGCCLLMRMAVDGFMHESASMGAPGVDQARWLAPVRPGDRLTFRATVLDTRASRSRPDRGFVRMAMTLTNQDGTVTTAIETSVMMARRQPQAA